jgi:hypothetical protein
MMAFVALAGTVGVSFYFVDHHNTWYFWVLLLVTLVGIVHTTWRVNRERLRLKELEKEMPWSGTAAGPTRQRDQNR